MSVSHLYVCNRNAYFYKTHCFQWRKGPLFPKSASVQEQLFEILKDTPLKVVIFHEVNTLFCNILFL